jgi:hypothetical protein
MDSSNSAVHITSFWDIGWNLRHTKCGHKNTGPDSDLLFSAVVACCATWDCRVSIS